MRKKDSSVAENWIIREGDQSTCAKAGKEVLLCKCETEVMEKRLLAKLEHKLNGVNLSECKDENGYVVYDKSYIYYVFDEVLVCGTTSLDGGLFKCSTCSGDVRVALYIPHEAKDRNDEANWTVQNEATCTKAGKRFFFASFAMPK